MFLVCTVLSNLYLATFAKTGWEESSLRRSKKSFENERCVKLSETYVKHFHVYL